MRITVVLALAGLLSARSARADQCQWLDDAATARRASHEVWAHPEYVAFCEPCGDAAPGEPRRATRVSVRVSEHAAEVAINGESVDLAYIYLKTSDRQYRNLAMLAGCATTGVSPTLRIDAATSTGVLICADRAVVAAAPGPAPAPAPAAVAPETLPMIVFMESSSDPRRWLGYVALLAALGAFAAWRMARRRPAHEPRAANLRPRR